MTTGFCIKYSPVVLTDELTLKNMPIFVRLLTLLEQIDTDCCKKCGKARDHWLTSLLEYFTISSSDSTLQKRLEKRPKAKKAAHVLCYVPFFVILFIAYLTFDGQLVGSGDYFGLGFSNATIHAHMTTDPNLLLFHQTNFEFIDGKPDSSSTQDLLPNIDVDDSFEGACEDGANDCLVFDDLTRNFCANFLRYYG